MLWRWSWVDDYYERPVIIIVNNWYWSIKSVTPLMCRSTTHSWVSHWFPSFPCDSPVSSIMATAGPSHKLNRHWLPLVHDITYSWVSTGLLHTVEWLLVRLVQSPWKRVFIVCCCSSHAWDQGVWTGSRLVHRQAGEVTESVKDSHPASVLKTLWSQSCLLLRIIGTMQQESALSLGCFSTMPLPSLWLR